MHQATRRKLRRRTGLILGTALFCADPAAACSVTFTTPGDGLKVFSPVVRVAGMGKGMFAAQDKGTLVARVNGEVFFHGAGKFADLVNRFTDHSLRVTLKPGPNVLELAGESVTCRTFDRMVVHYEPAP